MNAAPDTSPIAILGGTFDPVHYGHLRFADDVRRALGLSEVRLVPAGDPPHRAGPEASAHDRVAMLDLAVAEFPGLVVDDREVRQHGKSYTVRTLEGLRREHPTRLLWLLVGADAFRGLPGWHRWRDLFTLAHLVVVPRPGVDLTTALPPPLAAEWEHRLTAHAEDLRSGSAGHIFVQPIAPQPIAATALRDRLREGGECSGLLPAAVLAYIDRHRLYRTRKDPLQDAS
jgi:nicotinate-nucleotide adenylyltransferase